MIVSKVHWNDSIRGPIPVWELVAENQVKDQWECEVS